MTVVTATKATFTAALDALQDGDTLRLAEDIVFPFVKTAPDVGPHRWGGKSFATPPVIDLNGHTLGGLYWGKLDGLRFTNGNLIELRCDTGKRLAFEDMECRGEVAKGVQIVRGSDVSVSGVAFADMKRGLMFTLVDRIAVERCGFEGMTVDGAEFGECHEWRFCWNTARGFKPLLGAHPDFVQGWSRPTSRPSCDIVIEHNWCDQPSQGIGLFNHRRIYKAGATLADGTVLAADTELDDGGFDRVRIAWNNLRCGYPQAIAGSGFRDSEMDSNCVSTHVWTPPPKADGTPVKLSRASINIDGEVRWTGRNCAEAGAGKLGQDYPIVTPVGDSGRIV